MAVVFIEGFDALQTSDIGKKTWYYSTTSGPTINTTQGRRGGRCCQNTYTNNVVVPFPSMSTVYFGMAIKCYTGSFSGSTSYPLFTLGNNDDDGQVMVFVNASLQVVVARISATLATSTLTVPASSYFYIEVQMTAHNSTGVALVKVNGVEFINATGLDTLQTGSTATYNILTIESSSSASGGVYIDDMYIDNSTLRGDCRVDNIVPVGAGNYAQWDPSAGANWQCVDEIPYSASDYNSTSTLNEIDSFDMTTLSGLGDIYGTCTNIVCKKTDAGYRRISEFCRSNSTDYVGTEFPVGDDDVIFSQVRAVDPNTSAAWTQTNLNNAEFGYKLTT